MDTTARPFPWPTSPIPLRWEAVSPSIGNRHRHQPSPRQSLADRSAETDRPCPTARARDAVLQLETPRTAPSPPRGDPSKIYQPTPDALGVHPPTLAPRLIPLQTHQLEPRP